MDIKMNLCKCGCNGLTKWKFVKGHYARIWKERISRRIPREDRFCICGCKRTFECKINSKRRYINGHNNPFKGHNYGLCNKCGKFHKGSSEIKKLKYASGKLIIWNKDKKCPQLAKFGKDNPFYEKHHSTESIEKIRIKLIGRKHTKEEIEKQRVKMIGRKFTQEHRKNLSKSKKKLFSEGKLKPHNQGKHWAKEIREKIGRSVEAWWDKKENQSKMQKVWARRPSSYESKIISLIDKYNLPYKYVGNGKFWIENCNPDFVNVNGEKIVIEVYERRLHIKNYEEIRSQFFNKYGYKTIFISGQDLAEEDWENVCLKKIL